ncbi:GIY-YIG nuclease family protein [Bacillus shivajii]|uniref:GIY-YIG nuclease family protein n=1 Tax=Bacillus shivajii TaxID=1983719 RepID=UPI001CFC13B7|nr:GIY-YIG nuclease family protein [Bacillus shivajii]UCZ53295.1 GIY-YIG nuclease family protein [Bacillus shivajii]
MNDRKHFVYILKCKDNTFYTGYTTNVGRRLKMHEQGKGAKYTRGRSPLLLVHEECFSTKTEALQREHEIKQLSRSEKLVLIKDKKVEKHEHSKKL